MTTMVKHLVDDVFRLNLYGSREAAAFVLGHIYGIPVVLDPTVESGWRLGSPMGPKNGGFVAPPGPVVLRAEDYL